MKIITIIKEIPKPIIVVFVWLKSKLNNRGFIFNLQKSNIAV